MRGHEATRHFRQYRELGHRVISKFEQLQRRIDASIEAIGVQRQNALDSLADAYLLTLDSAALERAEKLTGFRGFSRRDPLKAMAHEKHVLETTAARIQGDERYRRREYLIGPNGEYTRELAERQSMLDPWQRECAKFEDLPGFNDLIDLKYDTPEFEEGWWQSQYWKHWAQGDAICEALGLDDFGDDVLPAYEKVRKPRDEWNTQVAEATANIDVLHALVQKHDQAVARIPDLPEIYLQQCQDLLAEFLGHADPALLNDWLTEAGGDRAILMALRRVAGLKAKIDVLQETRTRGLEAQITALHQRAAKHQRKELKYGRSKHYHATLTQRDTDPKFGPKANKLLLDADKLSVQLDRLEQFEDYSSFDLDQDPELWYIAFTRKRPSKFTPGLRDWYTRNPEASPVWDRTEDPSDDGLVGAAAGLIDRHDSGYLS